MIGQRKKRHGAIDKGNGVYGYPLRPTSYPPPSAPPLDASGGGRPPQRGRAGGGAAGGDASDAARPLSYQDPRVTAARAAAATTSRHSLPTSSSHLAQQQHGRTHTQALGRALTASARRIEAAPSDKEKVKTTTRVLSLATKYLRGKLESFGGSFDLSASSVIVDDDYLAASGSSLVVTGERGLAAAAAAGASSASSFGNFGTIRPIPRQFLSYHVRKRENGAWQATVSLVQPFVHGQLTDPQGTRPGHITLGFFRSEDGALAACRMHAPPVWAEPAKGAACYLCRSGAKALFKNPCHCRNCGQLVCSKCSRSRWPNGMLPPTYHNNESAVRVCDACNHLALHFRRALKEGDQARALELFASGNVNLWSPYIIEGTKEYPVHCAAEGGDAALLRWLVDELGCPLYDEDDQPLRTHLGDSVLGVAARHQHAHVMRWLVQATGCKVSEIVDRPQLWAAIEFLLRDGDGAGSALSSLSSLRADGGRGGGFPDEIILEEDSKDEAGDADYGYGRYESSSSGVSSKRRTAPGKPNKGRRVKEGAGAAGAPPPGAACVNECLLCREREVDCLILPCGHLCTCAACGQTCRECPACHVAIKRVVRTFRLES